MTKVLAVDNSIKGSVQFQFNESISYTALNMIIMAIRRSQIGYYSLFCDSAATNRGLVLPAMLQCFVEGVLDVYHSYLSCPCNMLQGGAVLLPTRHFLHRDVHTRQELRNS